MIDLTEIDTRQLGASVVDFIQQPKESRLSKSTQSLQKYVVTKASAREPSGAIYSSACLDWLELPTGKILWAIHLKGSLGHYLMQLKHRLKGQ
ncbi:MAG: hypothetical protein JRD47_06905 [Deltaproteobacteria bacterium]|nr:hypothetical protein [Deltaproteobacteria bacterium]